MRKVILLALMAIVFASTALAQVVTVTKDSLQNQRIEKIEQSLTKFTREQQVSIAMRLLGGGIMFGSYFIESKETRKSVFMIGGTVSVVGFGLYLDSFTKIDFGKKNKKKTQSDWWE